MKRVFAIIGVCCLAHFLLSGCQLLERKQQAGAIVELDGHYLYETTLDSLTLGLTGEDSAQVAQQFISQWAKDVLMYEAIKDNLTPEKNRELENLVAAYRRALYVHAYEEYLVTARMPKGVADSTIEQMYARMPEHFRLSESIVKGMLIVLPNAAPKMNELREGMSKLNMDNIEKYAYQYASGYELFVDRWVTSTDLLLQMPFGRDDLDARLREQKQQIEISDSTKTYILQVTDKHLRGEQMPLDYARPEIEKMVLRGRQTDFLQKERERLYHEAVQEQRIKFNQQ
ncbi:MAG: hypothetical protein K6A36_03495 [Paludibacteraceae bacterium]|nr:hypothetical protein [Paludibacteraceae bacterium]